MYYSTLLSRLAVEELAALDRGGRQGGVWQPNTDVQIANRCSAGRSTSAAA